MLDCRQWYLVLRKHSTSWEDRKKNQKILVHHENNYRRWVSILTDHMVKGSLTDWDKTLFTPVWSKAIYITTKTHLDIGSMTSIANSSFLGSGPGSLSDQENSNFSLKASFFYTSNIDSYTRLPIRIAADFLMKRQHDRLCGEKSMTVLMVVTRFPH